MREKTRNKRIQSVLFAALLLMALIACSSCGNANRQEKVFNYLKSNGLIAVGDAGFQDYTEVETGNSGSPVPFSGAMGNYLYQTGEDRYCKLVIFDQGTKGYRCGVINKIGNVEEEWVYELSYDSGKINLESAERQKIQYYFEEEDTDYGLKTLGFHTEEGRITTITAAFCTDWVENCKEPYIKEYYERCEKDPEANTEIIVSSKEKAVRVEDARWYLYEQDHEYYLAFDPEWDEAEGSEAEGIEVEAIEEIRIGDIIIDR